MMTLGTVLLALVFVVLLFTMMKKGGGCCGGHSSQETPKGGCCDSRAPQEPHDHHSELENADKGSGNDPVCGMAVENSSLVSEHQGKSYYFCSEHCQKNFADDPDKYV